MALVWKWIKTLCFQRFFVPVEI